MSPSSLTRLLQEKASELGFDLVGVIPVSRSKTIDIYNAWLKKGYAGAMEYLENHAELKEDPRNLLPETISLLALGFNYSTTDPSAKIKNPDVETFKQLYKSKYDDLYTQFCIDTSRIKNKRFYFNEYIQFTYWLFKYRVTISDGAKIASDTKKALRHIVIDPQSCFAPVLFQLG